MTTVRIRTVRLPTTGELLDRYYTERGIDPGSGRAVGEPVATLPSTRELAKRSRIAPTGRTGS